MSSHELIHYRILGLLLCHFVCGGELSQWHVYRIFLFLYYHAWEWLSQVDHTFAYYSDRVRIDHFKVFYVVSGVCRFIVFFFLFFISLLLRLMSLNSL